jgi:signal transduction histidine kinase/CheY-like chemotaxis protein
MTGGRPGTGELVRVEVRDTAGVFAARQLGREVAAELGLERQDQVRVATALSEVGRELVLAGQAASVVFLAGPAELVIQVRHGGPPPREALAAAARLMDRATSAGPVVELARARPPGGIPDLAAARRRLAGLLPMSALDELRRQNEDLIGALAQVQSQRAELQVLNAELEETNQGVMALYGQLSQELEQTNRGVVALYAELEEKSERLREASEAKNRFWANVSHELRSPLNSIIGLGRLLTGPGSELTADQRHQVELITGAGTGLLGLVNDLLDTAKAEAGQLQADPAVVQLPALLGRLRALLRPMTEDGPVSLVVDAGEAPAELLTDEIALTAILRNLLSNSLKYTDEGEVTLTVRAGPRYVEFVVADTGIGIPADQIEHIFEEFFQVAGVRRGGTGLGLPYARRLTELLGGQLGLTSQPGRGTTVTLRLPHGPAAVGVVLIADDDPAVRQLIRGLLAGLAGQVIEAADGEQALAAAQAGPVDLALVDLRMPGLDGYALLERLPAGIPAIIVSSSDPGELPRRASAVLRKDQLTADRLRYAMTRIKGVGDG